MRILFTAILLVIANYATAQQVNPVPDYVFANRMSVGRNAVTDTAAYFSIGPRYGANKGFMPPIVGDTAHVTASNKRNGLLIFSVQKNKFLYWDSVRVRWSDMAGSSGSYIVAGDTASMLSPYVRHAGYGLTKSSQSFLVDTAAIATRARVQKGIDSVSSFVVKLTGNQTIAGNKTFSNDATFSGNINLFGALAAFNELNTAYTSYLKSRASAVSQFLYLPGDTGNLATERFVNSKFSSTVSGTTNYVPKFTSSTVLGNSQIFDDGTSIGIGTTSPSAKLENYTSSGTKPSLGDIFNAYTIISGASRTGTSTVGGAYATTLVLASNTDAVSANSGASIGFQAKWNTGLYSSQAQFSSIFGGKENSTDGSLAGYLSFATRPTSGNPTERMRISSDGNVGIGTTSPSSKADILGTLRIASTSFVAPTSGAGMEFSFRSSDSTGYLTTYSRDYSGYRNQAYFALSHKFSYGTGGAIGLTLNSNGETLLNTETDAGAYALQVAGSIYSTTGAVLAASSGNVGIGGVPLDKMTVFADQNATTTLRVRNSDAGSSAYAMVSVNASGNSWGMRMGSGAANSNALEFVVDAFGTPSLKIKMHTDGGIRFVPQSAAPTAEAGTVYYDSDDNKLKVYNGTAWVDLH